MQAVPPSQRNANKTLIKSNISLSFALLQAGKSEKIVPVTSALGAVVVNGFGMGIAGSAVNAETSSVPRFQI